MRRDWYSGATRIGIEDLVYGDLVAWDYKPWMFVDLRVADDGRQVIQLMRNGKRRHVGIRGERVRIPKIDNPEHYPVCSCGDLMPCRDSDLKDTIEREMRTLDRYTTPGVCLSCGEVITTRQKSMSWPNVMIPGTPDVQFHLRWSCRFEAQRYDKRCTEAGHPSRFDVGTEAML